MINLDKCVSESVCVTEVEQVGVTEVGELWMTELHFYHFLSF